MYEAVAISDIHLGSSICRVKEVCAFLSSIDRGTLATKKLVLNGDTFDSFDLRQLRDEHLWIFKLLRDLSRKIDVVWISGNHDGPACLARELLGIPAISEHVLESGDERILFCHGDKFDGFLSEHPLLTTIGDTFYLLLQRLDQSSRAACWLKHASKVYLDCAAIVECGAVEYGRKLGATIVCAGHSHHAEIQHRGDVTYYNSGSWTESPGTYLTVDRGQVRLHTFAG